MGLRQLPPRCEAEDAVGSCTGPPGGRGGLGFVEDDGPAPAKAEKASQFFGVCVARHPSGAAADIQRQRRPGKEAARLAFAEQFQRQRQGRPHAELASADVVKAPSVLLCRDPFDHFSALTMLLNSRPRTSKLG